MINITMAIEYEWKRILEYNLEYYFYELTSAKLFYWLYNHVTGIVALWDTHFLALPWPKLDK